MTYQEKYSELHKNLEKSGKRLENALEIISQINGFGDTNELTEYFNAQKSFAFHSMQFNNLVKYATLGKIIPETEFVEKEFIYGFIKSDQQRLGTDWEEGDLYPGQSRQEKFYSCEIGLTNDDKIEKNFQETHYKFPVLNLNHGKECYTYLSERLQYNPDSKLDIESLDFTKVLDENKPIFVKIKMRTK